MALARAQAADDFMQKWFNRNRSHAVNDSAGSPMRGDDSMDMEVEATSSSPMDTNSNCDSEREQNEDDDQDEEGVEGGKISDCSSPDSNCSLPGFHRWPPTTLDAQKSATKMREKLAQLGLERKRREGLTTESQSKEAATSIVASCALDPFASAATGRFDFARSLDATDGAGSVGVMVEEDSFSATRNAYLTWQVQQQRHPASPTASPERTAELATLGLFACLPGELRNRIYRLILLAAPSTPYTYTMTAQTCALGACTHSRLPTAVPGLLSTCRQIRVEGLPIFVAENVGFRFAARLVAARCVANWVRALGAYAKAIRVLELEVQVYERDAGRVTGTSTVVLTRVPLDQGLAGRDGVGLRVEIAKEIWAKAGEQCGKIEGHVQELNERLMLREGLTVEKALYEVVGSDLMADLVWKCAK